MIHNERWYVWQRFGRSIFGGIGGLSFGGLRKKRGAPLSLVCMQKWLKWVMEPWGKRIKISNGSGLIVRDGPIEEQKDRKTSKEKRGKRKGWELDWDGWFGAKMETRQTVLLSLSGPTDFASDSEVMIWDLCVPVIGSGGINLILWLTRQTKASLAASPLPLGRAGRWQEGSSGSGSLKSARPALRGDGWEGEEDEELHTWQWKLGWAFHQ